MYSTALLLMFDFVSLGFYYHAVTFIHGINNSIYFVEREICSYSSNLFWKLLEEPIF